MTDCNNLTKIPGVGKSIARDLLLLGFSDIKQLEGQNPQIMYDNLCKITNSKQDKCLLYVFRCAVYFATTKEHNPELLKWWNWKD